MDQKTLTQQAGPLASLGMLTGVGKAEMLNGKLAHPYHAQLRVVLALSAHRQEEFQKAAYPER